MPHAPLPPGTLDAPVRPSPPDLAHIQLARDLYWQNVVREMLTGLSMMRETSPEIFDGRLAVLTRGGERIPIAEVFPMFACGVNGSLEDKAASVAVECTVFRIRTPGGEVFTFPLHEIRALHTLSSELLKHLERESIERMTDSESNDTPFGLAAFTSSGKSSVAPSPPS